MVVSRSHASPPTWSRRVGSAALALIPLLTTTPSRADDRDLQPPVPWVFFTSPDDANATAIDLLIENSFADLNLVVEARAKLVLRYGLWSVPRLVRELSSGTNEPGTINSALTVAALRGHLGPASELAPLIRPLVGTARAVEEWRRAAAMFALGSFQGPDGVGRPRHRADALIPLDVVAEAQRLFGDEVLGVLQSGLKDQSLQVRAAAALALGKTGGPAARQILVRDALAKDAAFEPQMAVFLARGLLAVDAEFDINVFVDDAFAHPDRRVRQAGALGAALQVVCDQPPVWTSAPARMVRALRSAQMSTGKEDTAEGVFLKGCLAWKGQDAALWDEVLEQAVAPRVEAQVASAAALVLLWCDDPAVRTKALSQVIKNNVALDPAVLASFLLRAGWDGTAEGVRATSLWLGNAGAAPRAERDWDVRWHATVGLLRAFADGHLKDEATRKAALEALEDAARKGLDRETPPLAALAKVLAAHDGALRGATGGRLPEEAVRDVEATCHCPHGLFARDLRDAAVARANAMIYVQIFDLAGLKGLSSSRTPAKDKEGTARRFFQRYLAAWPYLSRLDLLEGRGHRPAPRLDYDDPAKVLDRGPR